MENINLRIQMVFSEEVVTWIIQETGTGRIQKMQMFLYF